MKKTIFFFDYDGTLADETAKIFKPLPSTLRAIELLRQKGCVAALCTGRAKSYFPQTGINFDCEITSNGACCEINGKTLFNILIEKEKALSVINFCLQRGINFWAESAKISYISSFDHPMVKRMLNVFELPEECFQIYDEGCADKLNKFNVIYDDKEQAEEFKRAFENDFDITDVKGQNMSDVSIKGVDKGFGVKKVAQALKIDKDDIIAFGDGSNDFSMLEYAAVAVSPPNHSKRLDGLPLEIMQSVADDGVSKKINEILKRRGFL